MTKMFTTPSLDDKECDHFDRRMNATEKTKVKMVIAKNVPDMEQEAKNYKTRLKGE